MRLFIFLVTSLGAVACTGENQAAHRGQPSSPTQVQIAAPEPQPGAEENDEPPAPSKRDTAKDEDWIGEWRMGRAREGDGEDASLYLRALAFEQEGDMAAARKAYFELIKSFPKSPHVPGAYFAFGEHFLEQSKADRSKLDVAREFFRKVQQFPPPKNSLYALASYRLAEI